MSKQFKLLLAVMGLIVCAYSALFIFLLTAASFTLNFLAYFYYIFIGTIILFTVFTTTTVRLYLSQKRAAHIVPAKIGKLKQ